MISKKRSNDYNYMGLQMLYRRLPKEHAMKNVIHSKMLSAKAGIIGEAMIEKIFETYQFSFPYRVLHDISLNSNGKFQIDTLLLSPYFAVIFECKNIVGELKFENDPACLRRTLENGQEDVFESPEMQIDRNIYLLREWLSKRDIDIPIIGAIVFSSFKSIVVKAPDHTSVIYATSIPVYLRKLQRSKKYLTDIQMTNISVDIVQHHKPYMPFPMCKNWGIEPRDLITGVQCEKCERFGMEKLKQGWYCLSCGNIDRLAHDSAVRDWFALVNTSITNGECRKFLRIDSHQLSSRILNSMNLVREGNSKNTTKYVLKWK